MSRSNWHRLNDILAAIAAIDRAEAVGRRHPEDDKLPEVVLAASQFHVFTIGEAVKALPNELTAQRPDVPWSDVARMRDRIGHRYYKLDAVIVRATIGNPLDPSVPHAKRCSSTQSLAGAEPPLLARSGEVVGRSRGGDAEMSSQWSWSDRLLRHGTLWHEPTRRRMPRRSVRPAAGL